MGGEALGGEIEEKGSHLLEEKGEGLQGEQSTGVTLSACRVAPMIIVSW